LIVLIPGKTGRVSRGERPEEVCPAPIRVVRSLPRRRARKEAEAMCYSYREYRMEQEARRQREEEERKRREEQAKKAEKEKAEKERELVRA
jgi:hypothetical protein